MNPKSRTKTPLLLVAALVLGLGGTATAAATITGAQIKNGTVTGKDVKDRSLTASDLAPGTIPAAGGTPGPAGPAGPQGPAGPTGPQGPKCDPAAAVRVPVVRAEGIAASCDDTGQSIPNTSTGVTFYWTREVIDSANILSSDCVEQDRLFAPKSGVYLVTASIEWPAAADTGHRTLAIKQSGREFLASDSRSNTAGRNTQQTISTVTYLSQGDAIEIWGFHSAPSSLVVFGDLSTSNVTMTWVSP